MSRKDFELIAVALRNSRILGCSTRHSEQWMETVYTVAAALQAGFPRFDRRRFLTACGVEL